MRPVPSEHFPKTYALRNVFNPFPQSWRINIGARWCPEGAPGDPSGATRAAHEHEESGRRLPSVRILKFFDGWPQRVPKEPSVKKFPESDRREPPTRSFLSFQRRYQINAGSVFKLRTAIVKERSSRDPVGVQWGSSRGPAGIQQRPLRASGGFN